MKTYVVASAPPAKRRWKWFAVSVLALVFFSLLVPLAFLLGLHNRFPSGYLGDDRSPSDIENSLVETGKIRQTQTHFVLKGDALSNTQVQDDVFHPKDLPSSLADMLKILPVTGLRESNTDETKKPCEVKYGSYCIWSLKHKEELKDILVKKLKDQLFVARAYYPSIAKLPEQENFTHEVKQNIQDHEKMLSEAIVDSDLPMMIEKKIQKMEEIIDKAKSFNVECNNVEKKLMQILYLTEDEAKFHTRQGAFLYHLGVQTMPKSLHCLSMRLTVEYFKNSLSVAEMQPVEMLENPAFQHYVIFSKNVLASSVTINSTIINAKVSKNLVFHLLTDEQNYYAMKYWFSKYYSKEAVIHVVNIENLGTNISYNSMPPYISFSEEFRVSVHDSDQASAVQMRTEYLSIFGHAHFLLPIIFKNLKKVVVLDDDVVVQEDLSPLWRLDLKGKVNGAVHFCEVKLGQLEHYLGTDDFNGGSCTWMSGLNVVDLEKWREYNITLTYEMLLKEVGTKKMASWRAAALPMSLISFKDLIYPLEDTWVLSGLGNDNDMSQDAIARASVLHYNGNLKPWLELGSSKYKQYWWNFLAQDNQYMDECNVHA